MSRGRNCYRPCTPKDSSLPKPAGTDSPKQVVLQSPRYLAETTAVVDWLGFEVVDTNYTSGHEGWGIHLLTTSNHYETKWAILAWQYGRCHDCDPLGIYPCLSADELVEFFIEDIEYYDEDVARELFNSANEWLYEDTYCRNFSILFSNFTFPILRRVFPALIANEIVSVQPMTAPLGMVFFMDYTYQGMKTANIVERAVGSMRVYELARDLNIVNRSCLDYVRSIGLEDANHMTILTESQCRHVRDLRSIDNMLSQS